MALSTRRRHYESWVILVDERRCRPEYQWHATLLHRSIIGNSVMDSITLLKNAIIPPSSLESFMRSLHLYHESCPEYPYRWKNTFLLCIADSTKQNKRGVEGIMLIIWRWFQTRRGGNLGLMSEVEFKQSWRRERKRTIVMSNVRNEIEWIQKWVLLYYYCD